MRFSRIRIFYVFQLEKEKTGEGKHLLEKSVTFPCSVSTARPIPSSPKPPNIIEYLLAVSGKMKNHRKAIALEPLWQLHKKEPPGLAGGSSYAPVRLSYQLRPNRRIANLASAFLLLAARKRATRVGKAKLRTQFILFQLFLYVTPNLLFVLAYRIHVVAPAPEFTIAVFELQIAKSFIQHQAAFTLQITP